MFAWMMMEKQFSLNILWRVYPSWIWRPGGNHSIESCRWLSSFSSHDFNHSKKLVVARNVSTSWTIPFQVRVMCLIRWTSQASETMENQSISWTSLGIYIYWSCNLTQDSSWSYSYSERWFFSLRDLYSSFWYYLFYHSLSSTLQWYASIR